MRSVARHLRTEKVLPLAVFIACIGTPLCPLCGSTSATSRPVSEVGSQTATLTPAARRLIDELRAAEQASGVKRVAFDAAGNVTFVMLSTNTATDENLTVLKEFRRLNRVKINCSFARITPQGLAELGNLAHLETLELRGANPRIDPHFGMAFSRLNALISLRIEFSRVDPQAIELLNWRTVKALALTDDADFTDRDLARLAGSLDSIEELDVSRTGLTDASLPALSRLHALKKLIVRRTGITGEGVRRARFPNHVEVVGAGR